MTKNSSAGSIIHNLEATLFLQIKFEPILPFEIVDECLQKVSTRHLTGAIVVDMGNCTEHMLAGYSDGQGAGYSKNSVDPSPREPAACITFVTAYSV